MGTLKERKIKLNKFINTINPVYKLKLKRITLEIINWFNTYSEDTTQCTVINGYTSQFNLLRVGVPQRSVLGPLLFLVCINTIVDNLPLYSFRRLSLMILLTWTFVKYQTGLTNTILRSFLRKPNQLSFREKQTSQKKKPKTTTANKHKDK